MLIFSKLIYIRNKHDFTCVKLHSSFRNLYGRHHNPLLSSSPGSKSNTTDVTSGAVITYLSGSPVYIHHSPVYSRVRVARSSVKYFVNRCFSFFIWPLHCLTFFDLRILITSLVSSKFSCNPPNNQMKGIYKTLHRK